MQKSPAVFMVCNAHLDPVWQWEWEEGVAATVSTFRTAADLCEEFDGFIFNHNEAVLYEWVKEYEPALFQRIQRLVAEGRWHIMGGWYLQPDCNMPAGESFVRQILVGREYFHREFGVAPRTAINFDPFGHSAGLPQILARSGYDSYVFCRPGQGDCPLPSDTFTWRGADGSSIVGVRVPSYNSPLGGARRKVEDWSGSHPGDPVTLVLWGVGDHGGGPSRGDLRDLADLVAATAGGRAAVHSTPEEYVAALRDSGTPLPERLGGLNSWAVGCYTSQVKIKQGHRRLEGAYLVTERMATAASLAGLMEYPGHELGFALKDLLFSEFHDILPGSSIQPVEEMAVRVLDHGMEIVSRVKARAFFALAGGQPECAAGEIPILVYNPHGYEVEQMVECEFMLEDQNWTETFTDVEVYQGGVRLPAQVEKEHSNLPLDWRKRVAFRASLQPFAMNRFDCKLTRKEARHRLAVAPTLELLRFPLAGGEVAISATTGLVEYLRADGVEVMTAGGCLPLVIADDVDPWGMTVNSYRNVAGRFTLVSPATAAAFCGLRGELPPVRVVESGEARTVIEAMFEYGRSTVILRYGIPVGGEHVDVEARVFWMEKDCMLKLALPVGMPGGTYLGQTAYAVETLPTDGREAVSQRWTAVTWPGAALTVLNDGTYGSDFDGDEVRLTLLRSPAYTAHPIGDRPILPQDRYTPRIDQGERLFRFRLAAGNDRVRMARVEREAQVFNEPPMALSFFPAGDGAAPAPLVRVRNDVAALTAVKPAEDGCGIILRLYLPAAEGQAVALEFPGHGWAIEVPVGAFEVATIRVDAAARTWSRCNLMEAEA